MIQIAKRIDDTIEDGVYNVNEVAEKIGITRQQLARWRKGTSEPTALNLKRFCLLYNISADYILGIERRTGKTNRSDCTKYTFLYYIETKKSNTLATAKVLLFSTCKKVTPRDRHKSHQNVRANMHG